MVDAQYESDQLRALLPVLDAVRDAVWVIGSDCTLRHLNGAARRLFGISPAAVRELSLPALYAPKACEFMERVALAQAREQGLFRGDILVRSDVGEERPVAHVLLTWGSPTQEQVIIGFINTLIAEVDALPPPPLSAPELGLKHFAERIPAIVWTVDRDLKFVWSAGAGLSALGLAPGALRGVRLQEYFGTEADDFPAIAAHRAALLGNAVTYNAESRGRTFESAVEPLRAADGSIEGVIGVARDVTDHELARRELQRAQDLYRLITENANDLIGLLDATGAVLYVSPAVRRILGVSPDSVLKSNFVEWVHSEDVHEFRAAIAESLEQGSALRTFRARSAEGPIWLDVRLDRFADEPTGSDRVVMIARDVSERRKLEEQLLHAQKLESLGSLAGGIAHDFNNLLTVILGHMDLLQLTLAPEAAATELIDQVREASERAAALTQRLLAFGRRQLIAPRVIDLNPVLENFDKLLRRLIREHVRLEVVAESTWRVRVDTGQIENVIVNLVINAQDAMPHGGTITIKTADVTLAAAAADLAGVPAGDYVRVTVADTGTGMTDEVLAHVFEPFYTTKAPGKGTGLGLAMCYGAVRQSGGSILARSTLGTGTCFTIYLPRASQSAQGRQRPNESAAPRGGHETILVTEDDPLVARLVERVLCERGYVVLLARTGAEALRLAEGYAEIDLLITDVVLPELPGPQLMQRLRSRRPQLRVLFVSGYAGEGALQAVSEREGIAFLPKPFSPAALIRQVRSILDRS